MIVAKKSLGQHFLINVGVVDRIATQVYSLSEKGEWGVCEIGPGPGALTAALLAKGLSVTAFEIDRDMIDHLNTKFSVDIAEGRLRILHLDAMRISESDLVGADRWVFCGNLPYNVGSQIIFHLLENIPVAEKFCFMLQKEVVERFIAERGAGRDYGALSIKMAWITRQLGHFWVKPGSFAPPPKVDSGVFTFCRIEPGSQTLNPCERGGRYDRANRFVSRIFQQRRKMLRSQIPALAATEWGTKRPEELTPTEWLSLAESNE